jgi:hypothetical protein
VPPRVKTEQLWTERSGKILRRTVVEASVAVPQRSAYSAFALLLALHTTVSTWCEYASNLEENLRSLLERAKSGTYVFSTNEVRKTGSILANETLCDCNGRCAGSLWA